MRKSNRVGQKIGLLTIGEKVKVENGKHYYKAKCFCGNEIIISNIQINQGKRSCGCLGTLNEKVKITKELLVGIEKEKAIILLMWNGKTKEEAEKIYSDFRKEYLNNGIWL